MPRRTTGAPRDERGWLIASLVADKGSEARAASALGVGRGTINDVLRGRQTVGPKLGARLDAILSTDDGSYLRRVAASLQARPATGLGRARRLSRAERRSEGATRASFEAATPHTRTGLAEHVILPGETVEQAYRRIVGNGGWEEVQNLWQSGYLTDDFYEYAVGIMNATGSGGTNVEIEPLVPG